MTKIQGLHKMKIMRLRPGVLMPSRQTAGAVGFDLHAAIDDSLAIYPQSWREIHCGFAIELEPGWQAEVRGRSGLAFHAGMSVLHGVGTIDSDYRGEVGVPLYNHGDKVYVVQPNDRIAQMVIMPAPDIKLVEVDELSRTERGIRGMGSTGV